jgi:hypothetical protein
VTDPEQAHRRDKERKQLPDADPPLELSENREKWNRQSCELQ